VSGTDAYANLMAEIAMRTPYMTDDELNEHLTHWSDVVRGAATREAAARWGETIMPKGDR
jgi:hypothetical protein